MSRIDSTRLNLQFEDSDDADEFDAQHGVK